MKQVLAMTRKELLLWAQKPGSWVLVFAVPLLFIWIIQSVFGSTGTPVVTVFAVNEDQSAESQQVMDALRASENLVIVDLPSSAEAHRRIAAGERMAAVIVPSGFSESILSPEGGIIAIVIDPARAEQANVAVGLVNAALGPTIINAEVGRGVKTSIARVMFNYEQANAGTAPDETQLPGAEATPDPNQTVMVPTLESTGASPAPTTDGSQPDDGGEASGEASALRQFFNTAMQGIVANQVQQAMENPQVRMKSQPVSGGEGEEAVRPTLLDYLVPGYSLLFVFFLIPNLALTVVEERETGTLNRLLVSPVARSRILLGKMLPYLLIAVAQFVIVLLASRAAFGISLGTSPFALALIILASALVMSALGVLIASLARTEGQADSLSIVVILAMAVAGGAMFPNISIPGIKLLTPHYWALQGFLNAMARGQGVESVLLPAGILLSMAAFFFVIGAVRFRFE